MAQQLKTPLAPVSKTVQRLLAQIHAEAEAFTLWHPSFDAIDEGALIPEYIAIVENGAITWERVEDNAGKAAAFGPDKLDKLLKQAPSLKTTEVGA
jgi:hypothetical protein